MSVLCAARQLGRRRHPGRLVREIARLSHSSLLSLVQYFLCSSVSEIGGQPPVEDLTRADCQDRLGRLQRLPDLNQVVVSTKGTRVYSSIIDFKLLANRSNQSGWLYNFYLGKRAPSLKRQVLNLNRISLPALWPRNQRSVGDVLPTTEKIVKEFHAFPNITNVGFR